MIELYARLLQRVRSINGLNQIQISLGNTLTPALALQFSPRLSPLLTASLLAIEGPAADSKSGETIGEKLHAGAQEWRERLEERMDLAGKAMPEPFVRSRLRRDVFLFSDPVTTHPRRLLILFGGGAMRPMMPLHVFLQHLDAGTTDVLLLRDPTRAGYRNGLFGVGETLEDIIEHLPKLADIAAYESVSTMGTSSGGMPALLAGLALGARGAISAGGVHPASDDWSFRGRPLSEAFPKLRCEIGRDSRVFLISGAQSPRDQAAALATAALTGATLLTVSSGSNKPVGHVTLFPLAEQRHLARVLEALLSADTGGIARSVPTIELGDVAARN